MADEAENPADAAGRVALERMFACLDDGSSFRLEAGAGAGKTFSLDKALRRLIDRRGEELIRLGRQVACITYTNVAKDEIISRIRAHPAVRTETIHGFCWSLLKDFQSTLRTIVPQLESWAERLEPVGGIGSRSIRYELGYPSVGDDRVTLRHDDVMALMIETLNHAKFRSVLKARYPILLIDEYQDTDAGFVDAIKTHFLDGGVGPQIGLFGDHWQKIYGEGCGLVEHPALEVIDKNANFRSTAPIVQMLNRMRPTLPQMVRDPALPGEARLFHTNHWPGVRRTGQGGGHWTGDTSQDAAKAYFALIKQRLASEGWDFAVEKTKVLMLSHSVLAREQGYSSIPPIYGQFNAPWLKKEDPHIKFLADDLEPACAAFEAKQYGEMFKSFGTRMPTIAKHADKVSWTSGMSALGAMRMSGTIGEVVDFIAAQPHMRLPAAVEEVERRLADAGPVPVEGESRRVARLRKLRAVPYVELIAMDRFINGHTPFATKHGVKGAEFENVLIVVGRGWNKYNFGQMLEWIDAGPPADKLEFFEDNRNLFYVACSRPKVRLKVMTADTERPNNSLEAKSSLLTLRLNKAMLATPRGDFSEIWSAYEDIIDQASGMGEFNAQRLRQMIEAAADIAGDDPNYTALVERLSTFVAERTSEAEGALVLLRRAQKLSFDEHFEMIRLLGRAVMGLTKKEHTEELIDAVLSLAHAYRSAGLHWAARSACFFGVASVLIQAEEDGDVPITIIPALKLLAWITLELQHIPDFLAAIQLFNGVARSLPLADESKELVSEDLVQLGGALASIFLNRTEVELKQLPELPDILNALGLWMPRSGLLFAMGHADVLRQDKSIPDDETEEDALELMSMLASQPAGQDDRPLVLNAAASPQSIETSVLGMRVLVEIDGSDQQIIIAETIVGSIEAVFATVPEQRVAPHTEVVTIAISLVSDISEPEFSMSEMDMKGVVRWPLSLWPTEFARQGDVQQFLFAVAGEVLGYSCFIDDFGRPAA